MDDPKKIGRYEILEELGRGAMGTVYKAKDPAMDRVVALKTIHTVALASQQGAEFRERFYREARAAGALAHPGIVPVFDVGEHEGMPFLVMEFVNGQTLADVIRSGERLSLDRVCAIGQRIAEALGYAHQRKVVHRDIKPANILMTSREAHGIERPKITDFGVAKLAEGQTTLTGQMLGTPAFMPPEQFTGAPIDGRADIFSLGVVLYWMATGDQPFPGESMTAVSYKVVHTEPVPPRKLNPSISIKLENVIMKCLAKSPDDRYQTGEELAQALGDLRVGDKAGNLQGAAASVAIAGSDMEATVIDLAPVAAAPATQAAAQEPVARRPVRPAPREGKRDSKTAAMATVTAVIVFAAVGGWYVLRSRQNTGAQVTTPPAVESAAPVAVPAAAAPADTPKNKTVSAPASEGASVAAKKADASVAAKAEAPPKAAEPVEPVAAAGALGFDPRTLDPKQSARLKIDAGQMPPGLDFTLEMNGKVYFRKSDAKTTLEDENLFVPAGVQEFRVTAKSGAVQKASNTVSNEFKEKKKNTLKIELRTQGMAAGSGVPQGLYADTQIVLTLK